MKDQHPRDAYYHCFKDLIPTRSRRGSQSFGWSIKKLHISTVVGRMRTQTGIFVRQLYILCLMTVAAFVAVCFVYAARKTRKTSFFGWMSAEGWTYLLFIWFAYGMILLWKGFIH